ncbi:MAG: hypothetical protein LBH75_05560 [Treponema sp.]|jgi:hypothetical protein|nr:hypothetical protein [Treponema sp.]
MVLYCINHTAFPAKVIARHLTAHGGEELAVLSAHSAELLPIYTGNITFIHALDCFPGRKLAKIDEVKAEIIRYYDTLFENAGIDIYSLTEIYAIFDGLMAVSLYFTFKEVSYTLIEQCGHYSRIVLEPSHVHFQNLVDNYKELYHEYGWGKLKKKIYHPETTQFDGDPPYEYFDYLETLKNMTDEQKEKLFSFFKFDKQTLENKTFSIFFPNSPPFFFFHFNKYHSSKFPESEPLYYTHIQYFLDFYRYDSTAYKPYPGTLHFKLKPDDYIDNPIAPPACLAEFLPHIKGLVLENIYSIASTSLDGLSPFAKHTYRFGYGYFNYFFNLPSVYFLLFLADAHKLYNLTSQNIEYDQIKKHAELAFPELAKGFPDISTKGEDSFQIINVREIMKAPGINEQESVFHSVLHLHYKRAALALINFDYEQLFEDSLFNCGFTNKFCLIVKIEKTQVKPKILVDLNAEYILLWVKDSALRAEILKTNITKDLPNTGVKLTYKVFKLLDFLKKNDVPVNYEYLTPDPNEYP